MDREICSSRVVVAMKGAGWIQRGATLAQWTRDDLECVAAEGKMDRRLCSSRVVVAMKGVGWIQRSATLTQMHVGASDRRKMEGRP